MQPTTSTMLIYFIAALLLVTTAPTLTHAAKYIGCYVDHNVYAQRDLNGLLFLHDGDMTVQYCETRCAARGYQYFGVQYGSECWCGHTYGKHGAADDDSRCDMKCAGNEREMCGGASVNSVYAVSIDITEPTPYNTVKRPLLGLVMMVKDEAHTLPQTLQSVKPFIDVWYILDTGSTDGTQAAINATLGDIPGELWEEPFVDYGTSRNRILQIAQDGGRMKRSPVFSFMLSADETVYNMENMKSFCKQHEHSTGDDSHAYPVMLDVGWRFESLRLSRTDDGWRYLGAVHEVLASLDGKFYPAVRVPSAFIQFKATDIERRSAREDRIRDILLREKAKNPLDTRTSFYLARTYNNLKEYKLALDEFHRRVQLGGWQEEVYESLYAIGWMHKELNTDLAVIQEAWLAAHNHSPERGEPLFALSNLLLERKQFATAHVLASQCITLPYPPKPVLWVQRDVYTWQCHFVVALSGLELGEATEVQLKRSAVSAVVATTYNPSDLQLKETLERYKGRLSADEWQQVEIDAGVRPGIRSSVRKPVLHAKFNTDSKSGDDNTAVHADGGFHPLDMLDDISLNHRVKAVIQRDFTGISTLTMIAAVVVLGAALVCATRFVRRGKLVAGRDRRILDKVV